MLKQSRSIALGLGIAAAGLLLISGSARAQLERFVVTGEAALRTQEKNEISLDTARRIAEHCEAAARAQNEAAAISILNQFGEQVFFLRMDGLRGPRQLEAPIMKANHAIITRQPSRFTYNRILTGDTEKFHQAFYYNIFTTPGGLSIVVDDQFIGAIGVGGSSFNEKCAHDAFTAVLGPQPPLEPTLSDAEPGPGGG